MIPAHTVKGICGCKRRNESGLHSRKRRSVAPCSIYFAWHASIPIHTCTHTVSRLACAVYKDVIELFLTAGAM